MKTALSLRLTFLTLFLGLAVGAHAQVVLSKWSFENFTTSGVLTQATDQSNTTAIGGLAGDSGFVYAGVASGSHASAETDWTTPAGNGSANALSANNWTIGDYFQFSTSTAGYESISLTWSQISSGTGPANFDLQYSTNGTEFTTFASYVVLANTSPNTWSATLPSTASAYSFDLSSISSLSDAATVYFRLTNASTVSAGGATVQTGGTDRVDNFTISGVAVAAVPEPSTYAAMLAGLALVGGVSLYRRRRNAA